MNVNNLLSSFISKFVLCLAVLLCVALAALAQMGGRCMGGGMGGSTSGLSTFITADFSGSGICAQCHSQLDDSAGRDVSIDAHWRSTMMANAAKDPLWQAKISSEVLRSPSLQSVIEEKCSRCHMGMARYQAQTDGLPVRVVGTGFLSESHPLHAAAMDGVSCTLCHQIQSNGLGTTASFTGQYYIDTSTSAPYRTIFGQYQDPMGNPMRMHSGFTPAHAPHVSTSALCGTCHTLHTPIIDAAGNVVGEFPEQMTYPEWQHAGTVQSCQSCHMPTAQGGVTISNRPMMLSPRTPFGQHYFVGGNAYMVKLMRDNPTLVGSTATSPHLDATISRTNDVLQNSSASVEIMAPAWNRTAQRLSFTVDVQNKAGHKLPSGVPSRRAWLHVIVRDRSGAVVFESGKAMPDGTIAANPADTTAGTYQPHYDVIRSAGQTQIYEAVMLDSARHVTQTLLRAAAYAKDNRLLPAGFDKRTASGEIAVVGDALPDANFTGGKDRVLYDVSVPATLKLPLTITVELLYQTVAPAFATDLRQDSANATVGRFLTMYDASDRAPKLLASAQKTVTQ